MALKTRKFSVAIRTVFQFTIQKCRNALRQTISSIIAETGKQLLTFKNQILIIGYLPDHTYSAHWIANPSFRDAVDDFLASERRYVSREIGFLKEHAPFRKTP